MMIYLLQYNLNSTNNPNLSIEINNQDNKNNKKKKLNIMNKLKKSLKKLFTWKNIIIISLIVINIISIIIIYNIFNNNSNNKNLHNNNNNKQKFVKPEIDIDNIDINNYNQNNDKILLFKNHNNLCWLHTSFVYFYIIQQSEINSIFTNLKNSVKNLNNNIHINEDYINFGKNMCEFFNTFYKNYAATINQLCQLTPCESYKIHIDTKSEDEELLKEVSNVMRYASMLYFIPFFNLNVRNKINNSNLDDYKKHDAFEKYYNYFAHSFVQEFDKRNKYEPHDTNAALTYYDIMKYYIRTEIHGYNEQKQNIKGFNVYSFLIESKNDIDFNQYCQELLKHKDNIKIAQAYYSLSHWYIQSVLIKNSYYTINDIGKKLTLLNKLEVPKFPYITNFLNYIWDTKDITDELCVSIFPMLFQLINPHNKTNDNYSFHDYDYHKKEYHKIIITNDNLNTIITKVKTFKQEQEQKQDTKNEYELVNNFINYLKNYDCKNNINKQKQEKEYSDLLINIINVFGPNIYIVYKEEKDYQL